MVDRAMGALPSDCVRLNDHKMATIHTILIQVINPSHPDGPWDSMGSDISNTPRRHFGEFPSTGTHGPTDRSVSGPDPFGPPSRRG